MIILTVVILLAGGLVLSYAVNFFCDILPLTVDDPPKKFCFQPVCPHCKENKSWRQYFLFQPCSSCGRQVSKRNWIVLILLPILFIAGYFYPPHASQGWVTLLWLLLIFYFMIVAIIDITHRIVLRSLTFIGWVLSFGVGVILHGWPLTLLGGASALVVMLVLYYAGFLFSKIMAMRRGEPVDEALGFGDVYISIMAGFLIAFPDVFSALVLAVLLGGITSLAFLINMLARKDYKPLTPIPYAPFIILGTLIYLYR